MMSGYKNGNVGRADPDKYSDERLNTLKWEVTGNKAPFRRSAAQSRKSTASDNVAVDSGATGLIAGLAIGLSLELLTKRK